MDAGTLRERVAVQEPLESRNAIGESIQTWILVANVWASVEGISSRESIIAGQQQIAISHRVRLRYLPALTQSMRLVWRNRTLEIVSLLERKNRTEHELLCQETA